MEQIGKRFASVTALNAVTLRLNPGEIHGLIGENGAGKSTLIKILAGVYQADSGSATLDGHPLPLGNPAAIEAAGIRVIHQELNLIPHFTVAESVFLGQEYRTRWGALDRRRMKAATAQFFQQNWQLAIDPERLVRDLSLAERKLVQIARALIDGAARLVVFDEPTAPLEAQEASLVSSAILRLRDQGIAILYISHYLNEIATLCDRGTVLRNGEVVGYPDRDLLQNTEALIAMMVGREIDQLYTPRQRPAADNGATPLLSVRQLSDGRQFRIFLLIFSRAKSSASPACWAPDAMCWSTYSTAYARRNAAPSTSRAGRGAFVRQSRRSAPAWRWCRATAAIRG